MSPALPVLPPAAAIDADVARALEEDLGTGDVTAALLPDRPARAHVITREPARIAGAAWFERCFRALDPDVRITWDHGEGSDAAANARLCTIEGRGRALVSAERCALNFLQTLSATATVTARHVAAIAGTGATLLDTRKTIPGLRLAQKYAVRVGGGMNHRIGLFDAYLIKENHIAAAGSIAAAVADARARAPGLLLEVEVETLAELEQALEARVDRVLIDEFSLDQMRDAVRITAKRSTLEVSGGVSLDTIRAIAETGVDFISVGALTKHVRAIDLSMRVE